MYTLSLRLNTPVFAYIFPSIKLCRQRTSEMSAREEEEWGKALNCFKDFALLIKGAWGGRLLILSQKCIEHHPLVYLVVVTLIVKSDFYPNQRISISGTFFFTPLTRNQPTRTKPALYAKFNAMILNSNITFQLTTHTYLVGNCWFFNNFIA